MATEVITLGLCMVVERRERGFLRFGIDRLGGDDAGGALPFSLHPYGLRSRPRAPTKANDDAIDGADLLLFDLGGSNEGAIPCQDSRVEIPDEGDGGSILYGWTGSALSYVLVSGSDGKIRIVAPETIVGDEAQAKALVKDEALMQWINGVLLPALAQSPGGPITVQPPSGLGTMKLRAQ
jgi:hypothetical protein